jgi:hypothetical protein
VQEAKKINKGNLAKYINKFLHSVTMLWLYSHWPKSLATWTLKMPKL